MDQDAWFDLLERVNERAEFRETFNTAELCAANELLGAGCEDVIVVELGVSPLAQCCRTRGLRVHSWQIDALPEQMETYCGAACLDLLQYHPEPAELVRQLDAVTSDVLVLGVPALIHDALALHRWEDSDDFVRSCGLTELGEVSVGIVEDAAGRSWLARVNS